MDNRIKKGILAVSFGTTYRGTRTRTIEAAEQVMREQYPEILFYRAFSSGMIRHRIRERERLEVPGVKEALGQMKEDGVTHVFIQPTYVIDGIENSRLKKEAQSWEKEFLLVKVGTPLLTETEDYEKVVEVLWQEYAMKDSEGSLVFIGHGTEHESHEVYGRLEETFHRLGHRNVYVATVEGGDDRKSLPDRKNQNCEPGEKVLLAPLMLVAGDHAHHDMAGEEDSYLSRFTAAGYEVHTVLKGLGELEGIRDIYLAHLKYIVE